MNSNLIEPESERCAGVADIRGAPPSFPAPSLETRVKVIYDDTHVYVGTRLTENHVWATYTTKDSRGESVLGARGVVV